jgi:4'-phosphopantetheinyl transferase
MINVFWLEQTGADVPPGDDWLGESELVRLHQFRFPKRRADWRLGRWTAKCAISAFLDAPGPSPALAGIEIRPAPSGAPQVFFADQLALLNISISHREGTAICAVAIPGARLGCDLEVIEPRSEAFIADYFTSGEQALIARAPAGQRPRLLALLWSGKESALKALREGLRLDTQTVSVSLADELASCGEHALLADSWHPLEVRCAGGQIFPGWWQHTGRFVRTVVSAPAPFAPTRLSCPAHDQRMRAAFA